MSVQKREVEYSKEVDDVAAFLVQILSDAKAGKPVSEIAAGSVAGLINAIGGLDQVSAEFQNKKVLLQTLGYRVGEMAGILMGEEKPVHPVQPQ